MEKLVELANPPTHHMMHGGRKVVRFYSKFELSRGPSLQKTGWLRFRNPLCTVRRGIFWAGKVY
eukprot:1158766-Pelagomonas_calceolata.AAC.4